jgi:hypothetical protein
VDSLKAACVILSWGHQLHSNFQARTVMQHLRSSNGVAAAGVAEITALHALYMQ